MLKSFRVLWELDEKIKEKDDLIKFFMFQTSIKRLFDAVGKRDYLKIILLFFILK